MTHRLPLILLLTLVLIGCQPREDEDTPVPLTVFAASSLTEAFTELEQAFERTHPDIDVQLAFAGSQVLRLQIEQGAPAHVFASANPDHMQALTDAGLVHHPRTFAQNALVLITPLSNPAGIHSFSDLSRAERLVIGAERVPIGRYTRTLFERAGEDFAAVSEENNVRWVRAKVELGEADAAIVYQTDVSERVRAVPIPEALNVVATYPIGLVEDTPEARAFHAFVLSAEGRAVLERHGFSAP